MQDLLHRGLVDLFGSDSVHATPFNPSYYLPIKKYPKNLGKSPNANFFMNLLSHRINPANADLVIVAAAKVDVFKQYLDILDHIPDSTPIVFVDGGDRYELGGDLDRAGQNQLWIEAIERRPFDFIFKREYLKKIDYAENVFPMPFCMDPDAMLAKPFPRPDKDVSFWAVESDPIRGRALDLLTGQFDCDENGTGRNKKFDTYEYKGRRYHEELAKCKIVLSLRGGGWDTLRYWEVPALGPLMISTELGIVIPNDFEDGVHIARCKDDLSDLIDLCQHYLDNESERIKMAKSAYEHLKKHHTPKARAKYLMGKVFPRNRDEQ